jgi:plasmid stabilization system protein ParE
VKVRSLDVYTDRLEAIDFYEQDERRAGRGARFDAELRRTFARIADAPLSCQRIAGVASPILRRARVHRFPYQVVFYLLRGEPVIVAIAHTSRKPAFWTARLR